MQVQGVDLCRVARERRGEEQLLALRSGTVARLVSGSERGRAWRDETRRDGGLTEPWHRSSTSLATLPGLPSASHHAGASASASFSPPAARALVLRSRRRPPVGSASFSFSASAAAEKEGLSAERTVGSQSWKDWVSSRSASSTTCGARGVSAFCRAAGTSMCTHEEAQVLQRKAPGRLEVVDQASGRRNEDVDLARAALAVSVGRRIVSRVRS